VTSPRDLDLGRVPRHVALVMDGNGRWAQRRGLKRTDGHAAGEEALFDTIEGARDIDLRWMTVYAFSTENWRRPLDEVRFLMHFNESILLRRREELDRMGVRVRFIGRRGGRVPKRLVARIEETEALTAKNRKLTLTFAFNYGGRAELTDAVRLIAAEVAAGKLDARKVDEKTISRHLYAPDMPDPDLPALGVGVLRVRVHAGALARLPAPGSLRRDRRVPAAQPPLRRDRRGLTVNSNHTGGIRLTR